MVVGKLNVLNSILHTLSHDVRVLASFWMVFPLYSGKKFLWKVWCVSHLQGKLLQVWLVCFPSSREAASSVVYFPSSREAAQVWCISHLQGKLLQVTTILSHRASGYKTLSPSTPLTFTCYIMLTFPQLLKALVIQVPLVMWSNTPRGWRLEITNECIGRKYPL